LTKHEFSGQIFEIYSNIKFPENPLIGNQVNRIRKIRQKHHKHLIHNFNVMLKATCFDPLKGSSSGRKISVDNCIKFTPALTGSHSVMFTVRGIVS
jgi:Txe/YoeB family toxin of Txe-Axe toxin-antitoxin module